MKSRFAIVRRVSMVGVSAIAFFVSILEPIASTSTTEESYESSTSLVNGVVEGPLDLGFQEQFCEAFFDSKKRLDIDFKVNISTLTDRWTNIFQTDDLNSGFRIEIDEAGKLGVIVRSVDTRPDQFVGLSALGVVRPNTPTTIEVSVNSRRISVKINDEDVAYLDGNFQPKCNRVLIGGGFDETRTTIGDVQAVVRIQTAKDVVTFGLSTQVRDLSRAVFSVLLVCMVWEWRRRFFERKDDLSKLG